MKFISSVLVGMLICGAGLAAQASSSFAVRYETRYDVWDRSFHTTYGYAERDYHRNPCRGYRTCYESWGPTQTVYVEETIIHHGRWNGYQRVRVYRGGYYGTPYVDYYVHNRRVVYREYRVTHVYYSTPFALSEAFLHADWNGFEGEARDLLIAGAVTVDIGAEVALIGALLGNDDAVAIGLASVSLGALSMSAASEEQRRQTELSRQVIAVEAERQKGLVDTNP